MSVQKRVVMSPNKNLSCVFQRMNRHDFSGNRRQISWRKATPMQPSSQLCGATAVFLRKNDEVKMMMTMEMELFRSLSFLANGIDYYSKQQQACY